MKYAVKLQLLDEKPDLKPVLEDSAIKGLVNRLQDSNAGIPALKTGRVHYTDAGKAYWEYEKGNHFIKYKAYYLRAMEKLREINNK